jgi:hypothetical protein
MVSNFCKSISNILKSKKNIYKNNLVVEKVFFKLPVVDDSSAHEKEPCAMCCKMS